MNSPDKVKIHTKMRELYGSLLTEHNWKALKDGRKIHMTITLDGPFELWIEEEKVPYNPLANYPVK